MAQKSLREIVSEYRENATKTQEETTRLVFDSANLGYLDKFNEFNSGLNLAAKDGTLEAKLPYLLSALHTNDLATNASAIDARENNAEKITDANYIELCGILRQTNYPLLASRFDGLKEGNDSLRMQLVTLVVLAKHDEPMGAKEMRKELQYLVPCDFNIRSVQNSHHNALRILKKEGIVQSRKKRGSPRIHIYRIAEEYRRAELRENN